MQTTNDDQDVVEDADFNWQEAQERDMRLAELHFAQKISRCKTTSDDAIEYLVCHGWSVGDAKTALGL